MSLSAQRLRWSRVGAAVLLVAGVAALLVWWQDRAARMMTSLVPLDAQRLVIGRAQRSDIVLERDAPDADWRIVQPCALAVEPRRLSPLFEALSGGATRYARADVDAAGAGLDSPLATLTLDGHSLSIGGTDLSGERRYVASESAVELVPEWIWPLLNGGLSAIAVPDAFTRTIVAITSDATTDATTDATADATTDDGAAGAGDAAVTVDPSKPFGKPDLARWNGLQAVQIIAWPPDGADDPEPPAHALSGRSADPVTDTLTAPPARTGQRVTFAFADGTSAGRDIHATARFDALVHEHGGCAHLFPAGTLGVPSETTAERRGAG